MIAFIDCDQRLTAEEHFYLFTYYKIVNRRQIRYSDFHIHENLINRYNALSPDDKEDIESCVNRDPNYSQFLTAFDREPWKFEKPV